jgi:hypothetical protein
VVAIVAGASAVGCNWIGFNPILWGGPGIPDLPDDTPWDEENFGPEPDADFWRDEFGLDDWIDNTK